MDNMARPTSSSRFPRRAAAACAACLIATTYAWMRYSYCWETSLTELIRDSQWAHSGDWPCQAYAVVRCRIMEWYSPRLERFILYASDPEHPNVRLMLLGDIPEDSTHHIIKANDVTWRSTSPTRLCARVCYTVPMGSDFISYWIQAGPGRFTWQSIAGLIVGAIGIGVFAFELRTWLRAREAAE